MSAQLGMIVEIPGYTAQWTETAFLPPVGTRFTVHKHLTDGGTYLTLEVIGHEWRLEEPQPDPDDPNVMGNAYFSITVKTRVVRG